MITSILDNDLYKFSMGQAIFNQFPRVNVTYKFINRGDTKFDDKFLRQLKFHIYNMKKLVLRDNEFKFLQKTCYYLKPTYLDFLRGYRYDPTEIEVSLDGAGNLHLAIAGPWYRTVFWEVPLMSMISELHFVMTDQKAGDFYTAMIVDKATKLKEAKVSFADFGTRRRFSKEVQNDVVHLMGVAGDFFKGTSNVHFAHKYKLNPIGTQAHEWIMAHGAMFGYRLANQLSMDNWVNEYEGDLGIALTDTYTSNAFFDAFGTKFAKLFDGVRQDSGSPEDFARMAIEHYHIKGIDPKSKTIVFSDGLTTDRAIELHQKFSAEINCSFGIGTHFTNDVGCKPLNIVIKMDSCEGVPAIKLSDSAGKSTGNSQAIENCRYQLGIS